MKKKLPLLVLTLLLALSVVGACASDPSEFLNPETGQTQDATVTKTTETTSVKTDNSKNSETTTTTTTTTTTEKRIEDPADVEGEPTFNQGVMVMNDRIMELFGINETGIANYSNRINKLRDNLPESVTLYSMIVPTSSEFYTPADYHTGNHSQRTAIKMIYDGLQEGIVPVNAYDEILQHYE